jgi:hypothetical protein
MLMLRDAHCIHPDCVVEKAPIRLQWTRRVLEDPQRSHVMFFSKLALLSVVGSFFMVGCMVGPEEAVSEETLAEESQALGTSGWGYDDDDYDHDCGPDNNGVGKVAVCHAPPGYPRNAHTICIGKPAVFAHLRNHSGDYIGPCKDKYGHSK